MAKRRNHAPGFKAKVALEALSGNKTIAELSTEYGVTPDTDQSVGKAAKGWCHSCTFRRMSERGTP